MYPEDHAPRHVHGFIGSGEVIVNLRSGKKVALANRTDNIRGRVTRTELKRVLAAAAARFDDLAKLWKEMHK